MLVADRLRDQKPNKGATNERHTMAGPEIEPVGPFG